MHDTLLKVALNTNKIVVTMFYIIHDTMLKVALNINKSGHQDIHYTWHIVESGVKHQ